MDLICALRLGKHLVDNDGFNAPTFLDTDFVHDTDAMKGSVYTDQSIPLQLQIINDHPEVINGNKNHQSTVHEQKTPDGDALPDIGWSVTITDEDEDAMSAYPLTPKEKFCLDLYNVCKGGPQYMFN